MARCGFIDISGNPCCELHRCHHLIFKDRLEIFKIRFIVDIFMFLGYVICSKYWDMVNLLDGTICEMYGVMGYVTLIGW